MWFSDRGASNVPLVYYLQYNQWAITKLYSACCPKTSYPHLKERAVPFAWISVFCRPSVCWRGEKQLGGYKCKRQSLATSIYKNACYINSLQYFKLRNLISIGFQHLFFCSWEITARLSCKKYSGIETILSSTRWPADKYKKLESTQSF